MKSKSPQLSFRYYYAMDSEYELSDRYATGPITKTSSPAGWRDLALNSKDAIQNLC